MSSLGSRRQFVIFGGEVFPAEKGRAKLDVPWGRVLGLPGVVVAGVDWHGNRSADLLAGSGMEEDPLVKVTLG